MPTVLILPVCGLEYATYAGNCTRHHIYVLGQCALCGVCSAEYGGHGAQAKAGSVFRGAPPTQSYLRVSVGVAQGRSPGAALGFCRVAGHLACCPPCL